MKKENIELGLGWFDKLLQVAEKYKIRTILKAVLILLIICASVGFVLNPHWVFEQYNKWQEQQHTDQMEQRINNNEKLHIIIEKLLYKVDADRILLLECHNGESNINGLPFAKISAIYESLNDSVLPISQNFQQQQLSLFPFSNYMFDHKYFYGDTEALLEIDRGLFYKFKQHNINHFACYVLYGVNKPIAFLLIGFEKLTENHNCKHIKDVIIEEGLQMRLLLELNKK